MSATFTYAVTTPDGAVAGGECDFMVVPTTTGELGLMAEHVALVSVVRAGIVRVSTGTNPPVTIPVGDGLVEVRDNTVRILVSSATKPAT